MTNPMNESERVARYLIEAESGSIVRDMGGHIGDQIFEVIKRNGMLFETTAGATGAMVLASVHVLNQAIDFIERSMDDDAERRQVRDACALLFLREAPEAIRAILSKEADDGE